MPWFLDYEVFDHGPSGLNWWLTMRYRPESHPLKASSKEEAEKEAATVWCRELATKPWPRKMLTGIRYASAIPQALINAEQELMRREANDRADSALDELFRIYREGDVSSACLTYLAVEYATVAGDLPRLALGLTVLAPETTGRLPKEIGGFPVDVREMQPGRAESMGLPVPNAETHLSLNDIVAVNSGVWPTSLMRRRVQSHLDSCEACLAQVDRTLSAC